VHCTHLSTGNDDIFDPVLNLYGPIRVPHSKITRVEVSTIERASGRIGVLEVTLHDDVSAHNDFAERFAVAGDIYEFVAG
jgi:hypothetical protein